MSKVPTLGVIPARDWRTSIEYATTRHGEPITDVDQVDADTPLVGRRACVGGRRPASCRTGPADRGRGCRRVA